MPTSTERAIHAYRNEARFRMLVESCVVHAKGDFGRYVDPERADEEAFEIATRAAALLLQRVYEEDAELNALKIERDHYKKIAESALLTAPRPLFLQASDTPPTTASLVPAREP